LALVSKARKPKKYIDGACVLADAGGDMIFSTFDTRDVDSSQPEMNCGTHIITGGTSNIRALPGASRLLVTRCRTLLGLVDTPLWTSRTTQAGRSSREGSARAHFPS
jgi:hypothetical protein